jgi:DNA helicase II / ATP-dependent DNA helicase PcrA
VVPHASERSDFYAVKMVADAGPTRNNCSRAMPTPLAATDLTGPIRVLAGPGTGKTQLLVDLYADLVERGAAARGNILVLTFSTAAAEELGQRIDERLRDSYDASWISTFHSFCARLLRDHRPDPRRLLISGFQEQVAMREVLRETDPAALGPLAAVASSPLFAQDALAFVALLKQNRVHPAEVTLQAQVEGSERMRALASIYAAYQSRIEAVRLRDFRDLVSDAIALLDARPDVLARLRERFRYVLVDEFQDVDPAQFHLLRTLAPPASGPRLLVAGDPAQSIYGFRGTVPTLLSDDFAAVYGSEVVTLAESRRCPPAVLEAGGRLLAATQPTPPPPLAGAGEGAEPAVRVVQHASAVDEATFTAREVKRLLLERPGLRPGQIAVLLRSTSTHAAPFEDALRALGLPYEVRGLGGVARNQVVRFLLAYLHALHDPRAEGTLERLLGSGLSGVSPHTVGRLRHQAVEEGRDFGRVVRRLLAWLHGEDPDRYPLPWPVDDAIPAPSEPEMASYLADAERERLHVAMTTFYGLRRRARSLPLHALAYAVLLEAGVTDRLLALPLAEDDRRRSAADLRAALGAFEDLEEVWRRLFDAPPLLADVVDRLDGWVTGALDESTPAAPERDAVQVMTVHQSKGLEFDVVFLGGFARGQLPIAARAHPILDPAEQEWLEAHLPGFRPGWPEGGEAHHAEEARLAYVGMTRARRRLYLTYAEEYDRVAGPSPFLEVALPGVEAEPDDTGPAGADAVLTLAEAESLLAGRSLGAGDQERLAGLGVDVGWVCDPHAGQPFEPDLERAVAVDPGHFSPTTINDYLRCPRVYFYNHHPGLVPTRRSLEMERGSFVHEVLEEFHGREAEWRLHPVEEQRAWLEGVFAQRLGPYLERIESTVDRNVEELRVRTIVANYVGFATRGGMVRRLGTVTTEKKFYLDVDGAEVRGKIDRIIDTGDGKCEVVDYKTGNGYGMERTYKRYFGPDMYDVQLAMYYLACREGVDEEGRPLGLDPRYLSLWFPKKVVYGTIRQSLFPVGGPAPYVKEYLQHPVEDDDLRRGRELVAGAAHSIRDGDFAPRPRADAEGTCLSWSGCPHSAICPFGGQAPE